MDGGMLLDIEEETRHSPLGASSAERWMNCPGSAALIQSFQGTGEADEPEWTTAGSAAHDAAAWCLKNHSDAWETVGMTFRGQVITPEDADAIQVYLSCVRAREELLAQVTSIQVFIEEHISTIDHPLYYGTVDHAIIAGDLAEITDYKHGVGQFVDVVNNAQLKYYAWGFVVRHPDVKRVKLRIVQPRCPIGNPVREWEISVEDLAHWVETELLPAMHRTEVDDSLTPGSWCRFCPAKLVCSAMRGMFGAAANADPKAVLSMSDRELSREQSRIEQVKMYISAVGAETFKRLNNGKDVPDFKLVHGRADRVFKDGAQEVFLAKFGTDAFTEPSLKSPAQMEKLPGAETLVKEWAYSPQGKLTVASASDKRIAITRLNAAETFGAKAISA